MTLLLVGLVLVLVAGLLARVLERQPVLADWLFRCGISVGCLAGAAGALLVLASPDSASRPAPGESFGLDPLSAWFTAIFLGVGATVGVYGTSYLARERPRRSVGTAHLLLAVLLIALTGVVTARTTLAFLVAWEIMAIAAWLLVIFEREHADVRRAGLVYLILTHTSTIALFGMFAAWGRGLSGGTFAQLAAASTGDRFPVALVMTLGLIGFGIKAGVVPGHIWLPGAHAAAPSHVSALLSGVMLKVGIYGLLRMLLLVGSPPAWWGWTVLGLGCVSAVLGVMWALAQHDLKRLLAYHSIENIGIILLGLGLGALGSTYHQPGIALLGVTGALLHTLNHSVFKSLLFFGAGAVLRVTGTRNIDRLGGLARLIPRTAGAFLVASLAIVGLPPLNGFVSEWIIFRGLLEAGGSGSALRVATVAVGGLALAGALALACFTKVHGVLFLGSSRRGEAPHPGEERGLATPQLVLAGLCIGIGVLPFVVIPPAARVALEVLQGVGTTQALGALAETAGAVSLAALALLLLGALVWTLRAPGGSRQLVREAATWGCGYPAPTTRMQHTASSYAASLLSGFGPLTGSTRASSPTTLEVHVADPVLERFGYPAWSWLRATALRLRRLQTGRIFWYLVYVIAALVALLLYLWMAAR